MPCNFNCRCEDCPVTGNTKPDWQNRRFDASETRFIPTVKDHVVPGWSYTFKLAAVNNEGELLKYFDFL